MTDRSGRTSVSNPGSSAVALALSLLLTSGFTALPLETRDPAPQVHLPDCDVADPAPAPRSDHVDVLHGVAVPDPYRWMEELESERTRRWIEAEDARAREFAAGYDGRTELRGEVARLADVRRFIPPWKRGDRYFYLSFQSSGGPGTPGTRLHVRHGIEGAERTLISEADLPGSRTLMRAVPGPGHRGRLPVQGG